MSTEAEITSKLGIEKSIRALEVKMARQLSAVKDTEATINAFKSLLKTTVTK